MTIKRSYNFVLYRSVRNKILCLVGDVLDVEVAAETAQDTQGVSNQKQTLVHIERKEQRGSNIRSVEYDRKRTIHEKKLTF